MVCCITSLHELVGARLGKLVSNFQFTGWYPWFVETLDYLFERAFATRESAASFS